MPLVCLGLSHHTAPVEVREHHAFPAARMEAALVALRDYEAVREAAMLQTCGRLEIYADVADYEAGVAQIKSFLLNFRHGMTAYDIESYLYTLLGRQAVEHLLRVSTGLDSMLIGEAEILGQVKDAFIAAQQARSLGKTLHRLFREAMSAGKAARTQTRIGEDSTSIATAAIAMAKNEFGTLKDRNVVIVGAGKMARTAAKRLRAEGAHDLVVTNRTVKHASDIVKEIGFGHAVELPGLLDALTSADIVLTSTVASHFVLTPETVQTAMARRPGHRMFIVDIAVPRDVHPDVAHVDGVTLVDIDGLKSRVEETLEARREAIPQVEEIVGEYLERFGQWYHSRVAVPVIASLTQKAEAIRDGGIGAAVPPLPGSQRTRKDAGDRHVDDDHFQTAAHGRHEDPRQGGEQSFRSARARAPARRTLRVERRRRVGQNAPVHSRRGRRGITGTRTLSGKRVLVTRPAGQSAEFAEMLRGAGAEPVFAPTVELVPPEDRAAAEQAVNAASRYSWVVFTSANGVRAFFDILETRREDARIFGGARIAAIGIKTSQALLAKRVYADLVPQSYVAEDLAGALIAASKPGDKMLIYRAEEARDVLPMRLREAGRETDVVAAYKTIFVEDPDFARKVSQCDVLTFTSASTVRGFVHNLHGPAAAAHAAHGKTVACIGPITAEEARKNGLDVAVTAAEFTAEGLMDALDRAVPTA